MEEQTKLKKISVFIIKNYRLLIIVITFLSSILYIMHNAYKEYILAKQLHYVFYPEYIVDKPNSPVEKIYSHKQIEAFKRATNVNWDNIEYLTIGAGIRPAGLSHYNHDLIEKPAMDLMDYTEIVWEEDRDFDSMGLIYEFKQTGMTSFKRMKSARYIKDLVELINLKLSTNIQIISPQNLRIGDLLVLEHSGVFYPSFTNGFYMQSLYHASLDKNKDLLIPNFLVAKRERE